jgi:hypothetical protein
MKALLFNDVKDALAWSEAELRKTGLPEGSVTRYLYGVREHEGGIAEVLIPEKDVEKFPKATRDKIVEALPTAILEDENTTINLMPDARAGVRSI